MKKTILFWLVVWVMAGFMVVSTLSFADEGLSGNDQVQQSEEVAGAAPLAGPVSESPSSDPNINIDGVEISLRQIIDKAEQGDIYSQFDLAIMYFEGNDVPQNIDQASRWLLEAANRGHLRAQQYLASLYEGGRQGFPEDKDKAAYWSGLRGRLPSSAAGVPSQGNGSEQDISVSGFAILAVSIVFSLIAVAFIVSRKKIKTNEFEKTETISLDALENPDGTAPEAEITLDDLSES